MTEASKQRNKSNDRPQDALWELHDLAAWFGIGEATAYRMASDPTFPKAVRPRPRVRRWVPEEVKRWASARRDC